jgi:ketosteroid isomerase-like protein
MTNLTTARRVAFSFAALLLSSMLAIAAHADPAADAKTVTDAFNKAFEACDVPAVLALYEDNAIVIWPGQGEVATDKAAFEKIVKANCSGPSKPSLKEISSEVRPIDKNYIIHTGQLDDTGAGPDGKPSTLRIRTTELLHKSAGKWRYAVDHASVGLAPPPPAADSAKSP